jgi:tetratricopeptide (TPR) repeat protein
VPDFWIGHYHLAQTYEQLGEHELALDALNAAGKLSGGQSKVLAVRGYILAKIGKTSDAEAVLSLLEAMARDRYCPPYATALVYAGLGQDESVFKALENALEVRDVNLIFLTVDPKWQRYRAHSRFVELLHRCGFAIA